MERGFVKWFDSTKGFGFIKNEETGIDIFFHHTGTLDKVVEADSVSYEVEQGQRGPKAVQIKRLKKQ